MLAEHPDFKIFISTYLKLIYGLIVWLQAEPCQNSNLGVQVKFTAFALKGSACIRAKQHRH